MDQDSTPSSGLQYVEASTPNKGSDEKIETLDSNKNKQKYRYIHINEPQMNHQYDYQNNTVITSRYTIYSFLPKILFHEFSKLANAYFLIISALQLFKPISSTNGFPSSLPALCVIVMIDMIFAALEDYRKHASDHIANELPVERLNSTKKCFEKIKWYELNVGDIIKLKNYDAVPADILILGVDEPDPTKRTGICYVETKNLDGETNLKLRQGLESTYTKISTIHDLCSLQGNIICETPNNCIHKFCGSLRMHENIHEPISSSSMLLRGSTVRNTKYVYGIIINTGADTKIMMALEDAPVKWSNMDKRLNQQILKIICLMIILCLTGASISLAWNLSHLSKNPQLNAWYLFDENATDIFAIAGHFFIMALSYYLLLNSFIPVSLYVSMTSIKFLQSYFMNQDLLMYHEETDTPFRVRTMALNEELGQIDYIFSDKTGTLTCNIMEFRKCSINGISYGKGTTEVGLAVRKRMGEDISDQEKINEQCIHKPYVNFIGDEMIDLIKGNDNSIQKEKVNQFWKHLALSHTVMVERKEDDEFNYSASSPDEQALVAAAGCFGFRFVDRSPGKAYIETMDGKQSTYRILEVLEFNSTRKRMSVIIEEEDGQIICLCKGADTVIYERLQSTTNEDILKIRKKTLEDMERFASEGLRTLVIASSHISKTFYKEWKEKYDVAINDMIEIERRRNGLENEIDRLMNAIENNLQVLGATAIEDRLQEGVPLTIKKLALANIKIWMLTGDKQETAINIGYACELIDESMKRIILLRDEYKHADDVIKILQEYKDVYENDKDKEKKDNKCNLALIIDGEILEIALNSCPELFFHVADHCQAVIACRVSPAQKAKVVNLVCYYKPHVRTLAIGDGANDVGMIQAAHVGVGISGQEGLQAANSSDYSFAQFRYLSRLLLVHGRWNYIRMSKVILYMFYKNGLMNLSQYWYFIYCGFSGQKFFLEWGLQGFNLLFTSLPILCIGVYEQDLPDYLCEEFPRLYHEGQKNSKFNTRVVWTWIISCFWESWIISFGTIYGYQYMQSNGSSIEMWIYGCVVLTIVILVVNLKLALNQHLWHWIHPFIYLLSFMAWIGTAAIISNRMALESIYWWGVMPQMAGNPSFYILVLFIVITSLFKDFFWKGYTQLFCPKYEHLAQEVHILGLYKYADYLLSYPPPDQMITYQKDRMSLSELEQAVDKMKKNVKHAVENKKQVVSKPIQNDRGAAFSYDAESLFRQSFLITERGSDSNIMKKLMQRYESCKSLSDGDDQLDPLRYPRSHSFI